MNNKHTQPKQLAHAQLVKTGWRSLVRNLGPTQANKFLLTFFSGSGDSVKEFKKMWQNKTIDQIHKEIIKAKKTGEI